MRGGRLQLYSSEALAVGRRGTASPRVVVIRSNEAARLVRLRNRRGVMLRRAAATALALIIGVLFAGAARAEQDFSGLEFLRESGISQIQSRSNWSARVDDIYEEMRDGGERRYDCRRERRDSGPRALRGQLVLSCSRRYSVRDPGL